MPTEMKNGAWIKAKGQTVAHFVAGESTSPISICSNVIGVNYVTVHPNTPRCKRCEKKLRKP